MARTYPACGRPAVSVEDIGKSLQSRGVVRCASCDAVVLPHRLFSPLSGGFAIGVIFLDAPFLAFRDHGNWPYAIAAAALAAIASYMPNRYETRVCLSDRISDCGDHGHALCFRPCAVMTPSRAVDSDTLQAAPGYDSPAIAKDCSTRCFRFIHCASHCVLRGVVDVSPE